MEKKKYRSRVASTVPPELQKWLFFSPLLLRCGGSFASPNSAGLEALLIWRVTGFISYIFKEQMLLDQSESVSWKLPAMRLSCMCVVLANLLLASIKCY